MRIKYLLSFATIFAIAVSCENKPTCYEQGKYNHDFVIKLQGFGEEKSSILTMCNVSEEVFVSISTDSAWSLSSQNQTKLKSVRDAVSKPDKNVLLQKVIPLEDISIYMNNIYGGTIGGFVSEAADMKHIVTMYDVYWGLRLDYKGTKFFQNGAGYAVIRFYSTSASMLQVPYSVELGGTQPHSWPNGGGGFTTSALGDGGYPEWVTDGYNAPSEGAELFEVTPQGREILRSIYTDGKWQTFEGDVYPVDRTKSVVNLVRNGVFDGKFITTYCQYEGYSFIVRAEIDGMYHLTTTQKVPVIGLQVLEKGIYGLQVARESVRNVHEVEVTL